MKAELVLGNLKREREALNGKLERLETALGKEWQDEDQEYLCTQQYNAMCLYAHILDERIADIEIKLEEKKLAAKESAPHETSHDCEKMFKKDIDPKLYEKYINTSCGCKNEERDEDGCDSDDPVVIVVKMIRDIFGDNTI